MFGENRPLKNGLGRGQRGKERAPERAVYPDNNHFCNNNDHKLSSDSVFFSILLFFPRVRKEKEKQCVMIFNTTKGLECLLYQLLQPTQTISP